MRWLPYWLAVLSFIASQALAGALPQEHRVLATFSVLLGQPGAGADSGRVMASGTVIPVDSSSSRERGSLRTPRLPLDVRSRLQEALRLESVDLLYSSLRVLETEKRRELPAIRGSSVKAFATLRGFTEGLATYRIEFREGEKALADNDISVEMGKRAVIGAMQDPSSGPYFFLVVEPERPGGLPEPLQAESGRRPRLLHLAMPEYPPEAAREKVEGNVLVEGVAGQDGRPRGLAVRRSDSPLLNEAALQAVRQWRYQPPLDDSGRPQPVRFQATLRFRLE